MENPHTGKFDSEKYKADLRDQMKEKEVTAQNDLKQQQQFFNKATKEYTLNEKSRLEEKDFHSKDLRKKCQEEWKYMIKGKKLEKEIEKDSNILREKVVRGKMATPNFSSYQGSDESRNLVGSANQKTGDSWAVSSNRKNQPSDIYLWGTPSITSHQKSTYEQMFNDPIEQQKEKTQNNSILKMMKIEDQLAKPDYHTMKVPKGIYENLPTIENDPTIEDEDEDEEYEDDEAEKRKLTLIEDDQLSQGSIEKDMQAQMRDQYNTSAEIIMKNPMPQKLNSKRLDFFQQNQRSKEKVSSDNETNFRTLVKREAAERQNSREADTKSRVDSIFHAKSVNQQSINKDMRTSNPVNTLKKITQETLTKLNDDRYSKDQQSVASGIKSLIIKKRIHQQKAQIFGADKEKKIINGTTMNKAQLDHFNRHIGQMESEAIAAKRMSIIELNINKQYDDKEQKKRDMGKILNQQNKSKIMWQRDERNNQNHQDVFDDMTKPHIQGDQGYPQVPQLTMEQEVQIKKQQQQKMKQELQGQIQRNKKFINMYQNDFNKTTNQYFHKSAVLQNPDDDTGETKSMWQNRNQRSPYYATANQRNKVANSLVTDSMQHDNIAAQILSQREKANNATPSLIFSQASRAGMNSRSGITGPLSKHKLEPLKSQRVNTQVEQGRKSTSVLPSDKKRASKLKNSNEIWNNSKNQQVLDRIQQGFEQSEYRKNRMNKGTLQYTNIAQCITPQRSPVENKQVHHPAYTARGDQRNMAQQNFLNPQNKLQSPFSQGTLKVV